MAFKILKVDASSQLSFEIDEEDGEVEILRENVSGDSFNFVDSIGLLPPEFEFVVELTRESKAKGLEDYLADNHADDITGRRVLVEINPTAIDVSVFLSTGIGSDFLEPSPYGGITFTWDDWDVVAPQIAEALRSRSFFYQSPK
jgi:hypothetical protein